MAPHKKLSILLFIIIIFTLATTNIYSQKYDYKRWSIKTLSDKDTTKINFKNVVKTTVHEQVSLKRPVDKFAKRLNSETTVYSIDCYIVKYRKESDRDIHVIIKDIKTNETMIAEIPNHKDKNIKRTSRLKQFTTVREWFVDNIGKPSADKFKKPKTQKIVTITGVGFWDNENGQNGMAANGREIHPILSMKFKK